MRHVDRNTVFLRAAIAVWLALMAPARYAWSQGEPVGPEFRINTYITGHQQSRAVSSDSAGNFVVAWISEPDSFFDIYAQRFASTGVPLGPQFRVNSYVTDGQLAPSVASSSAGSFVVTWQSFNQDGSGTGSFAQRYSSSGTPLGGEFQVNTYTTSAQFYPRVALDSVGNFVIVWNDYTQDGSGIGVYAQRYASNGTPLGLEFRVNTFTTGRQTRATVASSPAGDFVVVWQSDGQDGDGYGVFAQRYSSTGVPLGGEFRVNTTPAFSQSRPAVAFDGAGNFVVAWNVARTNQSVPFDIVGRRYDSTGAPLGDEFRVNAYNRTSQFFPAVAADAAGDFVVAWASFPKDGSSFEVLAQRFDGSGAPLGSEFRVNSFTPNLQSHPAVASDAAGHFVIVWDSHSQDGSAYGVFGQRYGTIAIVPLEKESLPVE